MDAKTVFELVILCGDHLMILGSQHPGGQYGDLFVLRQQGHRRKGRLGSHGPSEDEIRLFVKDQFFHRKKGVRDRHARLEIPRVDDLDLEGPLLPPPTSTPPAALISSIARVAALSASHP